MIEETGKSAELEEGKAMTYLAIIILFIALFIFGLIIYCLRKNLANTRNIQKMSAKVQHAAQEV